MNNFKQYTCFTDPKGPKSLIDIIICGVHARVCIDTGAIRSIAGERLHELFKKYLHAEVYHDNEFSRWSTNHQKSVYCYCHDFDDDPRHKFWFGKYIECNASAGAVLLQGKREEEHPIEHASRLFNSA
ncbi:hypothetical protein AVEN_833-1 [Araneus ventricosus]|uniref:Uncharacterized protein n=1 Tax=Araneus ventricosus TaxID=182803 RepID=A0A4Y2GCP7_ARAVE|nr:hypothetical protein AVEN_833-1 [Araneus ventricosus]